jgi:hypothetical protein
MYESDSNSGVISKQVEAGGMCKMPTSQFRVNFQPSNDFEKGLGVAIIVDGVLCTSKESAMQLITKRVDDIYTQWAAQIAKM